MIDTSFGVDTSFVIKQCGRIRWVPMATVILLQYPTMEICLTDSHTTWYFSHDVLYYWIKWAVYHLQPMYYFVIVVAPHMQTCVDYYSLITFLWHHTILGHIYEVIMFQTIVMSQVGLSNFMMFAAGVYLALSLTFYHH